MVTDTARHIRKYFVVQNPAARWMKRFDATYYMIRFRTTRSVRGWQIMCEASRK